MAEVIVDKALVFDDGAVEVNQPFEKALGGPPNYADVSLSTHSPDSLCADRSGLIDFIVHCDRTSGDVGTYGWVALVLTREQVESLHSYLGLMLDML